MESMQELGIPYIKDSMGGDAAGAFWFLQSLNPDDESRSTSQGFLVPRSNLHVLTGNIVTRVLFETGGASGVEFSQGEGLERNVVSVSKEVILSAGALHTPQILQLSGIGSAVHLSSLGIEVVEDLPGVGENYQDHLLSFTGQTGEFFSFRAILCSYMPVNVAVSSANFTNATWSNEMLELYETSRQGKSHQLNSELENSFYKGHILPSAETSSLFSPSAPSRTQPPSSLKPPRSNPPNISFQTQIPP